MEGKGRAPIGTAPGFVVDALYKLHNDSVENGIYKIPYNNWATKWFDINVKPEANRLKIWSEYENDTQINPQGSNDSQC